MIVMSFTGQVSAFRLCLCKFKIKTDTALTLVNLHLYEQIRLNIS